MLTFFSGYEFTPNTMAYLDVEEAGWGGISGALGLAGFTNLDVVRNPSLGAQPYIARLMIQQIIPLSKEKMEVERTALSLPTQVPVRRLEIRFGKFSLADFFDLNVGGSDSHYQFLNWVIANNGAWDYAADTRGYTVGAIFDYEDRNWGLRFAEVLMPKVANGPNLDADVARARAENIELELRPKLLKNKDTTIRFLNYVNHANMGDYEEAVRLYLDACHSHARCHGHSQAGDHQVWLRIQFRAGGLERYLGLRALGMERRASTSRSPTRKITKAWR